MKSSETGPESSEASTGSSESRQRVIVPRVTNPTEQLAAALAAIRVDLELPTAFPPEVEREAAEAVAAYALPDLDLTDIEFVTIDPEGSTDLDQAVHCARSGDGYVVHYAIADVPAFVVAGGAVDAESRERGQTLYGPDGRIPLHPTSISEDAASLLENQVRGAYVWTMALDAAANVGATTLERARIRSRHQYSYPQVQQLIDDLWVARAQDDVVLVVVRANVRVEVDLALQSGHDRYALCRIVCAERVSGRRCADHERKHV